MDMLCTIGLEPARDYEREFEVEMATDQMGSTFVFQMGSFFCTRRRHATCSK